MSNTNTDTPNLRDEPTGSFARRPDEFATSRALWLVGIFFAGLLLVVGLKFFFTHLHDELDQRSHNERARMFIGEEIVHSTQQIEKDVFYMTTLVGETAQARVEKQIAQRVDKLRHDLMVLKNGGTVRQVIYLNIEGHDQMVREMRYQPPRDVSGFIMEIIEIEPLLDEINHKTHALRLLLSKRAELRDREDRRGLFELEQRIATYLKHLPPFFFRVNENANRLFFESSDRLKTLEIKLATERSRYQFMENLSVVLVILVATLVGVVFARQIRDSNKHLRLAWEQMRAAKEIAERASQAKSDFVSRMSHELRTPMNAILGFAQLLDEEDINIEQREYVKEINRAGMHLLELINQVLDLAKIEAGGMTLERIAFDPMRIIDEVATLVAERARDKGLSLRFFASPNLPSAVLGDPTRLRQVLINLVGNAVKFTEQGHIDLRVLPSADGDRIEFSVEDTGIGMDDATLSRLFRPFSQADESTTRKYGGTGLGLIIAKDLVKAMGGEIKVSSTPGVGSRFWFDLPANPVPDTEKRPQPLLGYGAMISCGVPHQFEVLTAQLQALGALVTAACGPERIMSLIEEEPRHSWIFVGKSTCLAPLAARLPAAERQRHILLQLPGDTDEGVASFDGYLEEPFTYSRLLDTVREILARRERQESPAPTPVHEPNESHSSRGRLLLVEDDRINRMVAGYMLDKLGWRYDVADNGQGALDKLAEHAYDLVLMDVQMPVMDGLEATSALRVRETLAGQPHVPVIATTANAMSGDRERCLASGMNDHIAKPIKMDDLAAILEKWRASGDPGAYRE